MHLPRLCLACCRWECTTAHGTLTKRTTVVLETAQLFWSCLVLVWTHSGCARRGPEKPWGKTYSSVLFPKCKSGRNVLFTCVLTVLLRTVCRLLTISKQKKVAARTMPTGRVPWNKTMNQNKSRSLLIEVDRLKRWSLAKLNIAETPPYKALHCMCQNGTYTHPYRRYCFTTTIFESCTDCTNINLLARERSSSLP